MNKNVFARVAWVSIFGIAFGLVEAAVVIYLRGIYYPDGFAFPLAGMSWNHIGIEISREAATILMLAGVGMLAGSSRWQRFGYFLIAFAVWDLFYYVWLKALLDWPASITEWDVLFLIPIPWIGPVLAPVGISVMLLLGGVIVVGHDDRSAPFVMRWTEVVIALLASGILLYSFMSDTEASLHAAQPDPYKYALFAVGMAGYALVVWRLWRRMPRRKPSDSSRASHPRR